MSEVSGETAEPVEPVPPVKRRGPRKEADIRAEVESEMRESLEEMKAQIRAEMMQQMQSERDTLKAEFAAELAAKEKAHEEQRKLASEAIPITAKDVDGDPTKADALTIHFVEDGFTVLGKVWYRGEELTLNPGTEQWEASLRDGQPFALMDEYEQELVYGKRFFRPGPWRGLGINAIDDPELTDDERVLLEKAAADRDSRYGSLTT